MKILVTGGTNLQVKPPESRWKGTMKKIDVPGFVVDELRNDGHDVTWTPIAGGMESVLDYDVAWVNWAAFLSRNSPNTHGALWTIGKRMAHGLPTVVFLDDWMFSQGFSHLRTIMKRDYHYLNRMDFFSGALKMDEEALDASTRAIIPVLPWVGDITQWADNNVRLAVPLYEWGDIEVVRRHKELLGFAGPIYGLDPSQHVADSLNPKTTPPTVNRRWILPALWDHTKWVAEQSPTWPVEYYGTRKLKAPRLADEDAVFDLYRASTGALAPSYRLLEGSGWFRSRFLYGALAGTYVYADPSDRYPGWVPLREFEQMSHTEQIELTAMQAMTLFTVGTRRVFAEKVRQLVN